MLPLYIIDTLPRRNVCNLTFADISKKISEEFERQPYDLKAQQQIDAFLVNWVRDLEELDFLNPDIKSSMVSFKFFIIPEIKTLNILVQFAGKTMSVRDWYDTYVDTFALENGWNMNQKKQIRQEFRYSCFSRDRNRCAICRATGPLDAHHITDRNLMPNGGYVPENGISLCEDCHLKAEEFHSTGVSVPGYSPEELYAKIKSSKEIAHEKSLKLI